MCHSENRNRRVLTTQNTVPKRHALNTGVKTIQIYWFL